MTSNFYHLFYLHQIVVLLPELYDGHSAKKPVIQMVKDRLELAKIIECINKSLS